MKWTKTYLLLAIVWLSAMGSCSSHKEVSRARVITGRNDVGVVRGLWWQDTTLVLDYLPDLRRNFENSDSGQTCLVPQPKMAIVRHGQLSDHISANSHSEVTDSLHRQETNIKHGAATQAWAPWTKYLYLAVVTFVFTVLGFIIGYLFKALNLMK